MKTSTGQDSGRQDVASVKPVGRPFWLLTPGLLWLMAFMVLPVLFMVAVSFWNSGYYGTRPDFTFKSYIRIFQSPLYVGQLIKTLRIGLEATALSLLISYPIAFIISQAKGGAKALLILMLFLPFWASYVVRAFVWLPILGRNGAINSALMAVGVIDQPLDWLLYNEGSVLLGLVYVYTLFMALPIYMSLEKIDPKLIEAATDLGARPFRVFWEVLLPLSMPGVASGCIMVFLLTMSAYVTPQLLGGPQGIMIGNIIASQFLSSNDWAFGSALSVILIIVVMLLFLGIGRKTKVEQIFTGGG
jgi:spermidine/putrescine transport system permease protein